MDSCLLQETRAQIPFNQRPAVTPAPTAIFLPMLQPLTRPEVVCAVWSTYLSTHLCLALLEIPASFLRLQPLDPCLMCKNARTRSEQVAFSLCSTCSGHLQLQVLVLPHAMATAQIYSLANFDKTMCQPENMAWVWHAQFVKYSAAALQNIEPILLHLLLLAPDLHASV